MDYTDSKIAAPRSARYCLVLLIGCFFTMLLVSVPGSRGGVAQEPAVDMALANLQPATAARVMPMMPQAATASYFMHHAQQERGSVMTKATGSAEGGDPVITILGATGLVGQELLELIPRAWPGAKLQLFASRKRTMECHGKTWEIEAADMLEGPNAPKGDLAMVALDDDFSRKYVPILLDLGYRVVDKSNCYRMDPNVPLVVGGVNTDLVTDDVKLVANPNCNTIPFCLAVAPLQRKYGLKAATVSSYQAISGAGVGTLDSF